MLYYYLIYTPLYSLYRKGPWFNGMGFWCGKSDHEICSYITHTDSQLWLYNSEECLSLIHKHYESFEIIILIIIYAFTLHFIITCIFQYLFIWRHLYPVKSHKYIH